jgi:hypothetical protein
MLRQWNEEMWDGKIPIILLEMLLFFYHPTFPKFQAIIKIDAFPSIYSSDHDG